MKNRILLATLTVAALLAAAGPALAQSPVTLTGTNYFQDFNTLTSAGGLPAEWTVREGFVTPTSLGNLAAFNDSGTVGWATTTGQFLNAAGVSNNGVNFTGTESTSTQTAATNRAPAVRVTAAFGDTNNTAGGGVAFALEIANTTGLGNFKVDLDFLLLSAGGRSNIWTVDYGFGATPTSFSPIGTYTALDTNNGAVFGATHKSLSFSNALDNNAGPVWIRVADETVLTPPSLLSGGSGNRPEVGIDNFSLSYTAVVNSTNPVVIISQPGNQTVNAANNVTFGVGVTGTSPSYQWYQVQDGVTNMLADGASPSGDGANFVGSTGPSLTINGAGAFGPEAGSYYVVVQNVLNTTNSAKATLTVNDPYISTQPQNRTNVLSDLHEFDATATGSQPMDITWYHNGVLIFDSGITNSGTAANASTIFVTNSAAATNGGYWMVATNAYGSVTTMVATASMPVTPSTLITRWDFDATGSYFATAPLSSVGTGVGAEAPNDGVITNYFFANGALADPTTIGNEAWEIEDLAAQGTSNKVIGFQFNTSTAGYQHIYLAWQERHSATASKYMRVQYTADGVTWTDADVLTASLVEFMFFSSDLTAVTGVNDNPNFAFRIVAEFESTAIGSGNAVYDPTSVGSTYGGGPSGGTVRLDLMNVFGDPVGSAPTLTIQAVGPNAIVSWTGSGFNLQSATNAGPSFFSTIVGATSPYTNSLSGPAQFFRLISQ